MAGTVLVDRVQTNLTGYSVQEDATPLDPSSTTGGVGQLDFDVDYIEGPEGSIQLEGLDVELRDNFRGVTYGTIVDAALNSDHTVTVSADGRLGALVGNVTAKPMVDTLQNVVMYYLSLGGITDGIYIDSNVAFKPVAVPGFYDDLWLRTKQLVSVAGCEITLVSNKVVVRPIRSFQADTTKQTELLWHVVKGDPAQFIEINYYGNEWLSDSVVYPYTDDERANAQSWEVDEGAILEDDITTIVSMATIQQPVCQDSVDKDYGKDPDDSTKGRIQSVYSVYDADNKPVSAAVWRSLGGKIEASINDDTTSLHIKITGPTGAGKAPYRIVGRAQPGTSKSVTNTKTNTDTGSPDTKKDNKTTTTVTGIGTEFSEEAVDYPSLFIAGDGVAVTPKLLTLPTGVNSTTTVNETGTTVQVPTISTLDEAYTIGLRVAGAYAGSQMSITGSLTSINQISGSGSVLFRTLADFDADNTNKTFAQFDTGWTGQTIKQFDTAELEKVKDDFDNQVFGNVAGARIKYGDVIYRIGSATVSDEDIAFSASADTIINDFNPVFSGLTVGDFNQRFNGKSMRQFNRIPLTKKLSTATIYVPPVPTDPYPDTFYPDQLYPGADPVNVARVGTARVGTSTVG